MVYPGLFGVGPPGPPANSKAQQIRQSTAGSYPGGKTYTNVFDAMGSNAPASGVAAAAITVMDEVAENPHPIEAQNFELDFDQQGTDTADFGTDADYTGLGGS